MASSNYPHKQLYDPIRKRRVAATPEEFIRQRVLKDLMERLAFPPSMVAVEKELSQLPHLTFEQKKAVPKRRTDIIAFYQIDDQLLPLLVIECKAVLLNQKVFQQVVGYNTYVQSPYVGVANEQALLVGHFDPEKNHYTFHEGIPTYKELVRSVQK